MAGPGEYTFSFAISINHKIPASNKAIIVFNKFGHDSPPFGPFSILVNPPVKCRGRLGHVAPGLCDVVCPALALGLDEVLKVRSAQEYCLGVAAAVRMPAGELEALGVVARQLVADVGQRHPLALAVADGVVVAEYSSSLSVFLLPRV